MDSSSRILKQPLLNNFKDAPNSFTWKEIYTNRFNKNYQQFFPAPATISWEKSYKILQIGNFLLGLAFIESLKMEFPFSFSNPSPDNSTFCLNCPIWDSPPNPWLNYASLLGPAPNMFTITPNFNNETYSLNNFQEPMEYKLIEDLLLVSFITILTPYLIEPTKDIGQSFFKQAKKVYSSAKKMYSSAPSFIDCLKIVGQSHTF